MKIQTKITEYDQKRIDDLKRAGLCGDGANMILDETIKTGLAHSFYDLYHNQEFWRAELIVRYVGKFTCNLQQIFIEITFEDGKKYFADVFIIGTNKEFVHMKAEVNNAGEIQNHDS